MERVGKFYFEGDCRKELKDLLKQKGFDKAFLRRRLYSEDVLITYGLERRRTSGHISTQTRVSVRADHLEDAVSILSMLRNYQKDLSYSDRTTTATA